MAKAKKVSTKVDKLHPKAAELFKELALSQEEEERFWWVFEDISNYYLGKESELKRIYRGVGGTLFWGWNPNDSNPEENIWLSDICPLDSEITLHKLDWEKISSTRLLELTRDIINLLKEGRFSELKNFIIIGESASHKTIVTKALLNFAKSFTTVAYLNLPVLQEMVLGIDFFEQRRILNLIKEVGLLVLDDLGSETVSDYFRDSWIYKIISSRLTTKLPTLIVTNFSLEQLEVVEAGAKPTAFTRLKSKQLIKRIRNSYGIITTSQTSLEEAASLKL